MWTSLLRLLLTWRTDGGKRSEPHIAPTWSWACMGGRIIPGCGVDWTGPRNVMFRIIAVETTPKGPDPTGVITDGHLKVSSQVVPAKILKHRPQVTYGGWYWLAKDDDCLLMAPGDLFLDDSNDFKGPQTSWDVLCLLLRVDHVKKKRATYHALVLRTALSRPDYYERVALVSCAWDSDERLKNMQSREVAEDFRTQFSMASSQEWFQNSSEQVITII